MKISAMVMCHNEEKFIGPCLEAIAPLVDEVLVWDGDFWIGTYDPGDAALLTAASTDRSREIIDKMAKEHGNIIRFYMDGLTKLSEYAARNILYQAASGDYLLIVDCDEIWREEGINDLKMQLLAHPNIDDFYIRNKLFFWDPWHYVSTTHMRAFKIRLGREFYGANEVTESSGNVILDRELFFHYGYVDRDKVEAKMKWYDDGKWRGCGSWWFKNIYSAFTGDNADELFKKNHGTMHPWGRNHPGFACEEFTIKTEKVSHPKEIRQFFDSMGFEEVGYF